RLIGCGISDLSSPEGADLAGDLLDPNAEKRSKAERATDAIRTRFGNKAIVKGRALR
ncbi:DNA polymerase IV, partial [Sulfitobacter sp. MF3-043]